MSFALIYEDGVPGGQGAWSIYPDIRNIERFDIDGDSVDIREDGTQFQNGSQPHGISVGFVARDGVDHTTAAYQLGRLNILFERPFQGILGALRRLIHQAQPVRAEPPTYYEPEPEQSPEEWRAVAHANLTARINPRPFTEYDPAGVITLAQSDDGSIRNAAGQIVAVAPPAGVTNEEWHQEAYAMYANSRPSAEITLRNIDPEMLRLLWIDRDGGIVA